MISEDIKRQILDNTDIVREIGKFIPLKRYGQSYRACCPFHKDQTRSFFIDPDRKIFKCFGCGGSGDLITFVKSYRFMSDTEAIEYLVRETGITLLQGNVEKQKPPPVEINAYQINETIKSIFCEAFSEDNANTQRVRAYLAAHGIDEATAKIFQIGYAPPDGQWLSQRLGTQKAIIDAALNLGIIDRDNTVVFQDRLIFPIHDKLGRAVGFAARTIGREEPQYSGSPFQHGRHLYGLYENSSAIRKVKKVIIVNDYLDVLALYQKGILNVVGLCGTTLSDHQAKELSGLAGSCVLCVDEDEENLQDIQNAIGRLFTEGLLVKVAALSDGENPADIIEQTRLPIDFLCDQFISVSPDPDDIEWLESTANTLCKIVAHLPANRRIAIDGYLSQIERKLGISKEILVFTLHQITSASPPAAAAQPNRNKAGKSKPAKDTEEINAIISPRNLLLAWRKVKHFAQTDEVYFDSKLFEQFEKRADEYLFVLHHRLKKQLDNHEPYMPRPFRPLRVTKPQGGVRDIAIPASIEDRIVIQAILNIVAPAMEKAISSNSFGHRLSANFADSELTFKRWQNLYGKYQAKLRQFILAPASCYYLKADITAFYDRVDRKRLCNSIIQYVQAEWTILTVENFINYRLLRNNGTSTESELNGLPQGPAYGHFFANLYLADFDRFVEKTLTVEQDIPHREELEGLEENHIHQVTYCRYVDDIFILFRSKEEAERCKSMFAGELGRIGLSFSEDKTKIRPVTDRQLIVDEMKSKKYTLGKLLDNDGDLNIQQREKLYEVVETDFLRISESADMAKLADSINFLLSHITDTEYFTQNKDDLINLVIELLFSESFKHSAIGGVLKRTLPQMETPWAKRFAGYLRAPATPDFKRILFLQSVEENNFYDSLKTEV